MGKSSIATVPPLIIVLLVGGAVCAAAGQLFFATGARGHNDLFSFLNLWIVAGLALYALGTAFWIYSLSVVQLVQVYPFTVLTFVLVYLSSAIFLGERLSMWGLCGVMLVLAGLYLLTVK